MYSDVIQEEWKAFKMEHEKLYQDETEEQLRMKIFIENREWIAKHNQLYALGLVSYKLGVTPFADMSQQEFMEIFNGYQASAESEDNNTLPYLSPANVDIATSVDWRKAGAVTPIKNQGYCGACWAFSTTGALEGQHFRKNGSLVSLSEQNLIDCSYGFGNYGCRGGTETRALNYVIRNHGIDTEQSYSYVGKDNEDCRFNPKTVGATAQATIRIPSGNDKALLSAVATVGPISVAIDASSFTFKHYSGGIYQDWRCNRNRLTHSVLLVGYGTDSKNRDYWLVKNSWGTKWGEEGYVRMSRRVTNNCGISTDATYPLV
ncbi:cathepsin L-like [Hermetia illucens]|nr:cathepsin L-like [Hermetia illucens]